MLIIRNATAKLVLSLGMMLTAHATAHANCRTATPAEAARVTAGSAPREGLQEQHWERITDDIAVGPCDEQGSWCLAVGDMRCETDLPSFVRDVEPAIILSGHERLVVLRWTAEHGGSVAIGGLGVQVWTSGPTPRRLISVVTEWNESDVNEETNELDAVCAIQRTVGVDAGGIAVGRRSRHGRCSEVLRTDRQGLRALRASARSWTWRELVGSVR